MNNLSKYIGLIMIVTLLSSIIFFGVAVWLLYIEKTLQALLSFIIGLVLLSTSLAILREKLIESKQ